MTLGNPKTAMGFAHWALLGFFGALFALLIASFFPSIIPTGASQTKL